ncbi:MAG: c-type cytochrome [Acidimicrobiales bacterium]
MTEKESDSGVVGSSSQGVFLVAVGATVSFMFVLFVGLAITAAGLTEPDAGAGTASAGTVDGAEIYSQNCARCHGDSGEGGIGVSLIDVADRYPNVEHQVLVVERGRAAMPGFQATLTDEQIRAVVEYEREAFGG